MSEKQLPAPNVEFEIPAVNEAVHEPIPESDIDEKKMTEEYKEKYSKQYETATQEYEKENKENVSEAA